MRIDGTREVKCNTYIYIYINIYTCVCVCDQGMGAVLPPGGRHFSDMDKPGALCWVGNVLSLCVTLRVKFEITQNFRSVMIGI